MTLPTPFQPGPRLIDGLDLNRALGYLSAAYASGIVAKAAGTVANSTLITETFSQIDSVVSAADGILLPAAIPGKFFLIQNHGGNSMTVFAAGGSTINGTAGATGVAHADGKAALYFSAKAGQYYRLLSA
jgi:hypothetical protein